MKKYITILEGGTSSDDARDWMKKPFLETIRGYLFVCATTPFCSILIRAKYFGDHIAAIKEKYDFLLENRIDPIFPTYTDFNKVAINTIPLSVLKNIIAEFPREDEYTDDTKECEECNGSGSVEWEYKNYTKDDDCPVCDGAGELETTPKKTGNKVFAAGNRISIGNSYFMPERVQDLLRIAEILDCDIDLIHQDAPTKPSLFRIENCLVLLAPCKFEDVDKVLYKL